MTEVVDGRQLYSDRIWVRAAHPLPDDPMVQACALAYVSDLGTGFGRTIVPGTAGQGGPSIDHALWFHEPVRADEWVRLDLEPWKATPGRALYRGVMRDGAGRLGGVARAGAPAAVRAGDPAGRPLTRQRSGRSAIREHEPRDERG